MTLPIIIIASRAALRAVPPSIREAALGIGASKVQTVFHHVLPLAMPGIMTGTILGMAHALGETAPLLMIGMVAFIVDIPGGFTDPATILPVQIFMWADFPERGFQQKTSAAILILLAFLIVDERDRGHPAQALRAPLVDGVKAMNMHDRGCRGKEAACRARTNHVGQDEGREGLRLLRREAGALRRRSRRPREPGDGADRSVRLRQVDLPALPQPHERHHRRSPRHRQDHARRRRHLRQEHRRGRAARPRRHGVPEAEPVPEVDLRERRLRAAHPRACQEQGRARPDRRIEPAEGGAVERGQGPPAASRAPAFPAASSSACASRAPSPSAPK